MDNINKLRKSDYGTCNVRFIVDKTGHVSNVVALTMKKSRLAKIAIDAIENGPRWKPAQQNGKFVNAYRVQPVTVAPPEK
jgi:ribulose 1,5-bisphosphate synthetase/thiazole synthase